MLLGISLTRLSDFVTLAYDLLAPTTGQLGTEIFIVLFV
jgi:hypothetical protein